MHANSNREYVADINAKCKTSKAYELRQHSDPSFGEQLVLCHRTKFSYYSEKLYRSYIEAYRTHIRSRVC